VDDEARGSDARSSFGGAYLSGVAVCGRSRSTAWVGSGPERFASLKAPGFEMGRLAPERALRDGEDALGRADASISESWAPVAVERRRAGLRGVLLEARFFTVSGLSSSRCTSPVPSRSHYPSRLRRALRDVVDRAALRAAAAAAHALDEDLVGDLLREPRVIAAPEATEGARRGTRAGAVVRG